MNANELKVLENALAVIETLQAEIEALKISLSGNSAEILSKKNKTLPNGKYEPVAWMLVDKSWNDFCRYSSYPSEGAIPLYTHPVKELTNEEISDIRDKFFAPDGCNIYTFARALLKKAQEND
jgi:hypothetical protein